MIDILISISQGRYDNFNFNIAKSPDEAYSSVFADFHPLQEENEEGVEWRINRREAAAAAQSGRGDHVEGSGAEYYSDLSFADYEKARDGSENFLFSETENPISVT